MSEEGQKTSPLYHEFKVMLDNHSLPSLMFRVRALMYSNNVAIFGATKGAKAYETVEQVSDNEYESVIVVEIYNDAMLKLVAKVYQYGRVRFDLVPVCEGGQNA